MDAIYTAVATASGDGRNGHVASEDGFLDSDVRIPELDVSAPALDHDAALDLVEKAHQVCPYSNATRGNVEVTLAVVR